MEIKSMKTHLLDRNNNKTYCGLFRLSVLNVISDKMLFAEFEIDCNNCKKKLKSIRNRINRYKS